MKLLIEEYNGNILSFAEIERFDFDGEKGLLKVWYNNEPLTCYVHRYVKSVKSIEGVDF